MRTGKRGVEDRRKGKFTDKGEWGVRKKKEGGGRQTGRQVRKELKKETRDRQNICNRRKIRVKQRGTLECKARCLRALSMRQARSAAAKVSTEQGIVDKVKDSPR